MEKISVWAVLFRMSTESSVMIRTPFDAKTFTNSPDDQLDAGAWCLGRMGGSWVPVMFICGTQSEAEATKEELLERIHREEE